MELSRRDFVKLSGVATGAATSTADLKLVKRACPEAPLLVGSGAKVETAAELLEKNPDPSAEEISTALEDNICRCGTYNRINKAVADAAKQIKGA